MSLKTWDSSSSTSGGPPDEQELVLQAQAGDLVAFEKLYARYNDRICRYLSRMVGNDGVGCELAQDTFIKAWEALRKLRDPSSFKSWLYRIATNLAYTHIQQEKQRKFIPWKEGHQELSDLIMDGPEQRVEETELLRHALVRIAPMYRACLVLYVIEELPQRQIADILKMKESSVSQYVSRGKEALRQNYHQLVDEQVASARGGKDHR